MKPKTSFIISLILFLGILAGCTSIQTVPRKKVSYQGVYLKDLSKKYDLTLEWDSVSQVILLKGSDIDIRAMVGSDIVIMGDKSVKLTEPIRTVNSAIIVPGDFRELIIGKKIKASRPKKSIKRKLQYYDYSKINTVIIDAGHGGKDPGAIGRTGLYEKIVVLDISKRLEKILKNKGIKVVMTRKRDNFIPLSKRTVIASKAKADIFVSIHANSNPQRSINGLEVYVLKNLGFFEKNEDQRKQNYMSMYSKLNMNSKNKDLQKIVADMYDSRKQNESYKLAESVAISMKGVMRAKNRGLKKSRFFVLRNTLIPAILVEVGYLSNPKEEKLFKTKAYRQKVANGIARGILEYAKN